MQILYEDKHILAIEKEPNMPSQPDPTGDISAYTLADQYFKESTANPTLSLSLMHRIDRPVGGVLLFSKTKEANQFLSKQIQNNSIRKSYFAICEGHFDVPEAEIEDYLIKLKTVNMSKVVPADTKHAQKAILRYQVISEVEVDGRVLSLVSIQLITGRHHQIRCQMNHLGHPILGDSKYNKVSSKKDKDTNIALWSHRYSFYHPFKKDFVKIISFPNTKVAPWSHFESSIKSLNEK